MTVRITLALLAIALAGMAHPWRSVPDRWAVGIAIVVVLVVFAWWRGLFVTTIVARRLAIWRRNHGKPKPRSTNAATVLLRVDASDDTPLPVSTIAGYVDRFGIRCDTVRLTARDADGIRTTWVGMTLAARANLAALQARSADIPLAELAEVVGRRLADHLREAGLEVTVVGDADAPLAPPVRETWRAVEDDRGSLSAHAITVDAQFADRLAEVWDHPARETWTALEFSGTAAHPAVTAVAAIRGEMVSGVDGLAGRQRPVLSALDPRSGERLGVDPVPLSDEHLDGVRWQVGSGEHQRPEETGHPTQVVRLADV